MKPTVPLAFHAVSPKKSIYGLLILLTALFLAGCSPLIRMDQSQAADRFTLSAGHNAGQTFVAQYDGLAAVRVLLEPVEAGSGKLILHLRSDPTSTQDITSSSLSINKIQEKGYYSLNFPSQSHSRRQYYSVTLEIQGEGQIALYTGPASAYLNGTLYQDGASQDSQMAFGLEYDLPQAALGLARLGLQWLGILLAGLFLFSLPGWALLGGLWQGWEEQPWPAKVALASALGLCIYPLLMLWTSLVDLRLGTGYAWGPPLLALIYLVYRTISERRNSRTTQRQSIILQFWQAESFWPDLAFLIIAGLLIFTRFWAIRSVETPLWGDGMQHTMIAQLIVDNGGLFNSWQPYANLQTLTYHFGFHSQTAVLHWISGLPVIDATLWSGQLINVLAVLAVYPLAFKIGRKRWAGVAGVLVAGLLSQMPMTYINWGRYTQLAGQTILPAAVLLAWHLLEKHELDWKLVILGWIAWGGLALTHYRILIFAILFLPAYLLVATRRKEIVSNFKSILLLGIGAGFLFLPWFIHVFGGRILSNTASQLSTPAQEIGEFTQAYNSIGDMFSYLPAPVWILFILSTGWLLWKQKRAAAILPFWWFFILLAANPNWLNLPGAGALSNFAVFIAAYIPAGAIIGGAAGELMYDLSCLRWVQTRWRQALLPALVLVAFVFVAGWNARLRLGDLKITQGSLVTMPDVRAGQWIQANLPENARFLVNGFFAYGNSLVVGSDAGWWLPLLANRQAAIPPLNYGTEQGMNRDYVQQVNAVYAGLQDGGITNPANMQMLSEQGIDYLYIGQQQGKVNASSPALLDPAQILADPSFQLVYHQDLVWIFRLSNPGGG